MQQMTDDATVTKAFVVLATAESYADALLSARRASRELGLRIDLRGLRFHKAGNTLTFGRATRDNDAAFGSYPCYLPRGRWDDGAYLSIELADHYAASAKARFAIVAASGDATDPELKAMLGKARPTFPTVRLEAMPIYMGCIH
jgi:hypothetical protein